MCVGVGVCVCVWVCVGVCDGVYVWVLLTVCSFIVHKPANDFFY